MLSDGVTRRGQCAVRVADRGLTEMKDGCCKHGTGVAIAYAIDKVIKCADAATSDDRNIDGIGNRARQFEIIAVARAVLIHRSDQQFASAEVRKIESVFNGIDACRAPAAMREDFPSVAFGIIDPPRIDRTDNTLAAEPERNVSDEFRAGHCR